MGLRIYDIQLLAKEQFVDCQSLLSKAHYMQYK